MRVKPDSWRKNQRASWTYTQRFANMGGSCRSERSRAASGSTREGIQLGQISWSQPAFANVSRNDRPKIGCIGLGGMGTGDAGEHANYADVVAVCNVDLRHAEAAKNNPGIGKGKADVYFLTQTAQGIRDSQGVNTL